MGERTPHLDPDARGVFFGLSAIHTKRDMLRAVMEGVAYNVEVNKIGIVLALVDNNIHTYNPENQETSIITNNETL